MSTTEHWTCDSCYEAHAFEDEAREGGWVEFERDQMRETVFKALPAVVRDGVEIIPERPEWRLPARMHHDREQVCSGCLEWNFDSVEANHLGWRLEESTRESWEKARDKWWVTYNRQSGGWARVGGRSGSN